jgi:hypothetical protein
LAVGDLPVEIRQYNFVIKVLTKKKNGVLCPFVRPLMFFFPTEVATKIEITNDQYSNRRIPSVMLSVKNFPMNCVSYTDGINPSVKLFNGVVGIL